MKITIQGQDYTLALDAAHPLTIARTLNEPSVCRFWLSLPADGTLAVPVRNQKVAVTGDDGTQYFSGYLAVSPLPEYAGLALEGPRSRLALEAIGSGLLQRAESAGAPADVTPATIPGAVHTLSEAAGTLNPAGLTLSSADRRLLANDVTVCGEHEPVAYATEYFRGDGVTTQFYLAEDPYFPPTSKTTRLHELFNESALDDRRWVNSGTGGYLELGGGGLVMNGGRGGDGDTMLLGIDPVEMGGTLLLEATGIALSVGSTGILPGLFTGVMNLAACVAGFRARVDSGAVVVQPVMQGVAAGASFTLDPANQYTLRIRVHCPEAHRSLALYESYDGATVHSYGGGSNVAPAQLLFEIQEVVDGVAAMPVVLLVGTIGSLPPSCRLVAASSSNLHGTMRSLSLYDLGSAWVTTQLGAGSPATRRVGSLAHSAECDVERGGKLVFFTGYTPGLGELIAVSYRTMGRAVGRAVNASGQAALMAAGLPPVSQWMGTANSPAARCAQDCRNAAQALADAAASAGALWKGSYKTSSAALDADVQPGDALSIDATSPAITVQVIVRAVELRYRASLPDLVEYAIDFSNEWADELAIATSETVPEDAWLPAPLGLAPLDSLSELAVTGLSGSTVTVNAGATAPAGGGFEVRRRDFVFAPGTDADLVMRSATATMSFTRVAASDRFYVRAYDGATPPNYSEFSAALFFNLPLSM